MNNLRNNISSQISSNDYTTSFLETLLYKIAVEVKNAIDPSENSICVIFVYDGFRGAYKLRASTKPDVSLMSIELGPSGHDKSVITKIREEFDGLGEDKKLALSRMEINNINSLFESILDPLKFEKVEEIISKLSGLKEFGFTKFCIYTELPFVVSNASRHPILSSKSNVEEIPYSFIPKDKLSNLLCYFGKFDNLEMLFRIETSEDNTYKIEDIDKIKEIIHKYHLQINSYSFLSNLVSIGYHIDLRELCNAAANTIASLLDAKGCSIFLLDESTSDAACLMPFSSEEYKEDHVCQKCEHQNSPGCEERALMYRCYGTTGLCVIKKDPVSGEMNREHIKDPFKDEYNRACYNFKPNKYKKHRKPSLSLTEAVIWSHQNAYVDVREKDEISELHIKNQFTSSYKISRDLGEGKCSEDLWEKRGGRDYEHSQCILYAPLCFRERYSKYLPILGVIRILKPIILDSTEKNYFKPAEMHLFFSFAEQLSKCILNAKYLKFFNELSHTNSKRELYTYVVSEIPKFIGGTDCAIYIKRGNLLKMKAEWDKGLVQYFEDDDIKADFYSLEDENEPGYTKWVAVKGETLLFNSLEQLKRKSMYLKAKDRPRHRERYKNEPGPERYIGIPIFRDNDPKNELLGVFRICKSSEETLFTTDDELILSQICKRLCEELHKSKLSEEKRNELIHYFSKKLLDLIREVPGLQNVTSKLEANLDVEGYDITSAILSLIEFELNKFLLTPRLKVFKDFELFNNEILKEVPYYRDHFIHQYVVYLLGSYILEKIKDCSDSKYVISHHYYDEADKKIDIKKRMARLWFITSMFHDISYPFAKTSEWYQKIFSKFIPITGKKRFDFQSEILKYLFLTPDQSYLGIFDRIVEFHQRMKRSDRKLRDIIINALTDEYFGMDHAVLSALVVMNENIESIERNICGSAIIFHNRIYKNNDVDIIDFCSHPFAFLLIFCDFLHEWGRERDFDSGKAIFHQLKNIIVSKNYNDIVKSGFSEAKFGFNYENEKDVIYIFVHIEIADETIIPEKIKEAEILETRLRSQKPIKFCFNINFTSFSIPWN